MNLDEEQQSSAENLEQEAEATKVVNGEEAAPEQTEEQKKEAEAAQAAEKARLKDERRQASVQKRINELTAEKYANQKLAEQLAEQNARILAMLEGRDKPKQPEGEPKREQFEEYEDFITARAEWRAEQKALQIIERSQATQKEESSKRERESAEKTVEKQFLERRAVVEKEYPDFKEVVEDWEPNLPDSVVEMIVRIPEGALLSYHMAKNPELEKQFRDQPDYMHGVLLGQLIATLKSPAKVTAAPAPGKTVASKPSGTPNEPPSDPELYYAWAKKHLR